MPSYISDQNLVESCLEGNPGSWNQLVDDHTQLFWHVIHQVAFRLRFNLRPQDTEDICSEVYLEILRNKMALLRRYKAQSKLSTYLCVVAQRKAREEIQKRKKLLTPGYNTDFKSALTETVPDEVLRDEIGKLSKDQQAALKMKYLLGLTHKEMAKILQLSINSIGSLLSRSKKNLKGMLET